MRENRKMLEKIFRNESKKSSYDCKFFRKMKEKSWSLKRERTDKNLFKSRKTLNYSQWNMRSKERF
jgi:hypothetical protein